jgi:hypothetical protein
MITLKQGTLVKIGGFPFVLTVNTTVDGNEKNLTLAGRKTTETSEAQVREITLNSPTNKLQK